MRVAPQTTCIYCFSRWTRCSTPAPSSEPPVTAARAPALVGTCPYPIFKDKRNTWRRKSEFSPEILSWYLLSGLTTLFNPWSWHGSISFISPKIDLWPPHACCGVCIVTHNYIFIHTTKKVTSPLKIHKWCWVQLMDASDCGRESQSRMFFTFLDIIDLSTTGLFVCLFVSFFLFVCFFCFFETGFLGVVLAVLDLTL